MHTREAILPDAEQIHDLIAVYSGDGTLLPRSLAEICENVRDFLVVEHEAKIIGCGALHLYGVHLAEVRSVAVLPSAKGLGAGARIVRALLAQSRKQRVSCVCLFTRIPEFFGRMGFSLAAREDLPDKIYKDCCNCPRLHSCDEVAMVRGRVPKFAILERPMNLVIPTLNGRLVTSISPAKAQD